MIKRHVLVAIPSKAQRTLVVESVQSGSIEYEVTAVATKTQMWANLMSKTFYRCLLSTDFVTSVCIDKLRKAKVLNHIIFVGEVSSEQAVRIIQQGALDYIESSRLIPRRVQLALERPVNIELPSDLSSNLTRLVENAHSIHGLVAPSGNITYLNPIGVETLGSIRTLDEFCNHVCGLEDHDVVQQNLAHAKEHGFWQNEIQYQTHPDQEKSTLIVRIIPLRDLHDESLIGYGLLAHDITQSRAAAKRARESSAKTLDLLEQKAQFISTLSHEFRTPLSTILTSTELLYQYGSAMSVDKRLVRLERIKRQVMRMVDLLDEVLLMQRLENSQANWTAEPINVNEIVNKVIVDMREQYGQSHDYVVEGHVSAEFSGEGVLIRQAVTNLLSNATKYSPAGKQIIVQLQSTDTDLQISVQDQGIGIPEEDQAKLFDKFYRAHNTGTQRGTGLGLSITKRAIEMHNGTIAFKTQLNVGTTFTITLPLGDTPLSLDSEPLPQDTPA